MTDVPSSGGGKIRSRRAASTRKPYSRASSQRKTLFGRVTDTFKNLLNPITPKWLTNRLGQESHELGSPVIQQNQDITTNYEDDQPSTSANHRESHNRTNNNYKRSSPVQPRPPMFSSKVSSSPVQYFVTPPDTPPVSQQDLTPSSSTSHSLGGSRGKKGGKEDLLKHLSTMSSSKRAKVDLDSPVGSDSSFLRKEMKLLSANDNASVASSSGCSSSVQARTNTSGDNEASGSQRNLRTSSMESLPSSRTSSSHQQPTMSSHKRPKFNPAIFGMPAMGSTSSPNLHQSSFYNGPVQFGGANASGRSPHFATPYKIPSVTKVKVRHLNHQRTPARSNMSLNRNSKSDLEESSVAGMSSTAKKILQTLEKMSSPLNDARRIPMTRTPSSFMADRQKRRTVGGTSRLERSLLQAPPTVGISSPSAARLRRRSHMPMNNSLLLRKSNSDTIDVNDSRDEPGPSSITVPDSKSISARGLPAPISSMTSSASMSKPKPRSSFGNDTAGGGSGGGGKMKSQKRASAHYSAVQEEEEEHEAPDLPNVPLTLSNLPSFNFGKSMITSTPTIRAPEKKTIITESIQPEFNFASPLVKTTGTENEKAQLSNTNTPKFQFSSPSTKSSSVGEEQETQKARPGSNFTSGTKTNTPSLVFAPDPKVISAVKANKRKSSPLATPTNEAKLSPGGFAPAEALKGGSVMDILGGKGTKSDSTSKSKTGEVSNFKPLKQIKSGWSCGVCMVDNDDNVNSCVACTTPKPGGSIKPLPSVKSSNKGWDCDTCFVPNDPGTEKCVACETPQPGSAAANTPKKFSGGIFDLGSTATTNSNFTFGVPSTKNDSNKNEPNPLGLGIKKPAGSWSSGTGLVQNDASSSAGGKSQTAKPGSSSGFMNNISSKTSDKGSDFKFGLPSKSAADSTTKPSGWGSSFKKPSAQWECDVCMVQNADERKTCEACESPRPGTKKEFNASFKFGEASASIYKFGIPDPKTTTTDSNKEKTEQKKDDTPKQDSTISQSTTESSTATKPAFQFGVPAPAASSTPSFGITDPKPATTATFGVKITPPAEPCTSEPEKPKPSGLYSFGMQKKEETPSEASKDPKTSGFTFGTPGAPLTQQTETMAPPAYPSLAQSTTASVSTAAPTLHTFGSSSTNPLLQQSSQATSTVGFGSFNAPTQAPSKPDEQKPAAAASFAFGKPNAQSSTGAFQFSGSGTSQPAKSAEISTPTSKSSIFGQPISTQEAPKAGFSFGKQPDQNKPATTGFTGFGSGSSGAADNTNKPAAFGGFGASSQQTSVPAPATSQPVKSGFTGFGVTSQQTSVTPAAAIEQAKPPAYGSFGGFGSSQTTGGVFGTTPFGSSIAPNAAPSNSTSFGSSVAPNAAPSNSTLFGSSIVPNAAPSNSTPFGSNIASNAAPSSATPFGSSIASNAAPSSATPFGSSNPSQSTTFGQSNSSASSSGIFGSSNAPAFGSGAPNGTSSVGIPKPSFAFGQSSNNEPAQQKPAFGGFQLGANNNQITAPAQSGFNFNANTNQTNAFGGTPNKAPPAFNATPAASSTGFQFGNPTNTQSNGMFQFGAGSKSEQPNENKSDGMFVFGGNNAATNNAQPQQPSAGFNFEASATSSFNFGGSQPATPQTNFIGSASNINPFNATPSSTPSQARRQVRTARRRLKK